MRAQEVLVVAYYYGSLDNRRNDCGYARTSSCSFRIRNILNHKPIHILGLSAYYHDSAAVLIQDGDILAAAQEERFTRKKHDSDFPENAIAFCLDRANITGKDLDYAVFYEKPFTKFDRLLRTSLKDRWATLDAKGSYTNMIQPLCK